MDIIAPFCDIDDFFYLYLKNGCSQITSIRHGRLISDPSYFNYKNEIGKVKGKFHNFFGI